MCDESASAWEFTGHGLLLMGILIYNFILFYFMMNMRRRCEEEKQTERKIGQIRPAVAANLDIDDP